MKFYRKEYLKKKNRFCSIVVNNNYLKPVLFVENDDGEKSSRLSALSVVTSLKQLCNHPDLVMDKVLEAKDGFQGARAKLPPGYEESYRR